MAARWTSEIRGNRDPRGRSESEHRVVVEADAARKIDALAEAAASLHIDAAVVARGRRPRARVREAGLVFETTAPGKTQVARQPVIVLCGQRPPRRARTQQ